MMQPACRYRVVLATLPALGTSQVAVVAAGYLNPRSHRRRGVMLLLGANAALGRRGLPLTRGSYHRGSSPGLR